MEAWLSENIELSFKTGDQIWTSIMYLNWHICYAICYWNFKTTSTRLRIQIKALLRNLFLLLLCVFFIYFAYSKSSLTAGDTFQYVWVLNETALHVCIYVNTLRLRKILMESLFWSWASFEKKIFFAKIGIFYKAIVGPLSEAYAQSYSSGERIKLIICQIRHEISVTIHAYF